ncbi:hypothetical protein [Jiella avicenniae]|uniref:Uncharacterized protein n=1 Tax=Jiella avicenniae TaxID=2907202 RepID=A0A9X1T4W0_9HYPH|nr:hypothetical protein [Jiella avicenniae]MCE7028437.1 hypothetical protein [Jiella avicenniae]
MDARTQEERNTAGEAVMQRMIEEMFWAAWLNRFGRLCVADHDLAAPFLPPIAATESAIRRAA